MGDGGHIGACAGWLGAAGADVVFVGTGKKVGTVACVKACTPLVSVCSGKLLSSNVTSLDRVMEWVFLS